MKNIYRIPTTKNLYLIENCILFYKTLFQSNQKWSLMRFIFVVLVLNLKIILRISKDFDLSIFNFLQLKNSKIYLLKKDFNDKMVFFTFDDSNNYVYKIFPKGHIGYENELNISKMLIIDPDSKIQIPKIDSTFNNKEHNVIKIRVNSFKTLNPNKNQKNFINEYKKFHYLHFKNLHFIHYDFTYWNVSKCQNHYEIFDWEGYLRGPVENDLIWFYLTSKLKLYELNIDLNKLDDELLIKKIKSLGKSRHDKKIIRKYNKFIQK
jgi:hypothetical protein